MNKIDTKYPCPRCGGTEFIEHECGSDTWDDFVNYTSDECVRCGLVFHGWANEWQVNEPCADSGEAYDKDNPEHQVWEPPTG